MFYLAAANPLRGMHQLLRQVPRLLARPQASRQLFGVQFQ